MRSNRFLGVEWKFGVIELILAFYPILAGYSYGIIHLNVFTLLILDIMAFKRCQCIDRYKPLMWMLGFVIVHEAILMIALPDTPGYFYNSTVSTVITLASILIITPAVDFTKFRNSIYLVAIISAAGLLYHYILIRSGHSVTPIKLPFFPAMDTASRLYEEGIRPTSFYWEPAACIIFLMFPLFLSLYERRFVWTGFIVFAIFLSTSTNGIALSLAMLGVYSLTQKIKLIYKLLIIVLATGMVYLLLTSDMFAEGMAKIDNTELEENVRIMNGPLLLKQMPIQDILWGFPAPNAYDYITSSYDINPSQLYVKDETIFLSTFWNMLSKFGLFGLSLYLWCYIDCLRRAKRLLPYFVVLFMAFFTQGISLSGTFAIQMIFMLSFALYQNKIAKGAIART